MSSPSFTPALDGSDFSTIDFSSSGAAVDVGAGATMGLGNPADDIYTAPPVNSVVPDTSNIDLPGQLSGIPGGDASDGGMAAADPSGVNQIYKTAAVNPTPTGGYMSALSSIAASAASAFTTFVKGSPSVAVPAAKSTAGKTATGGGLLTTAAGTTNWTTIAIIVAVGIAGIVIVVKYV